MSIKQAEAGKVALVAKLDAICGEIFERWDKDQRSGKLLSALSGLLPKYRQDVTDIREALAAHDEMRKALENLLSFCDTNPAGETEFERAVIAARAALKSEER